MTGRKWTWQLVPEVERCPARPGPRSTARCEEPLGHALDFHAGRTRRGYWKLWPVADCDLNGTSAAIGPVPE